MLYTLKISIAFTNHSVDHSLDPAVYGVFW